MEYTIIYQETPNWQTVPKLTIENIPWYEPTEIKAWAQVCHNENTLFLRMEAEEKNIRAEETELLSQVCNDSCLEFFFAPMKEDPRYLNFEWNPIGTLYLGFGAGRPTRVRQIPKDPQELFCPVPFQTEQGWGIEFQIPLEFVQRYFPEAGFTGEAAANFYKCGDKTVAPHYKAWNPIAENHLDFHRRWDFGKLIFG